MDKESKSGGGLPGNGIVAIVLVAAGVLFVKEVPLQTTRPLVNEPRLEQQAALQDVDARLWQDPFGAVAEGRQKMLKKLEEKINPVEQQQRSRQTLSGDIERRVSARVIDFYARRQNDEKYEKGKAGPQRVEILAVMLPGGAYSESVESRRRTRYAVLAGLNANRLAPVETEHIGYFYPDPYRNETDVKPVPFEWFEPAADIRQRDADKLAPLVLVMWLQAESFSDRPLDRIRQMALKFDADNKGYLSWRVLGPNGSDGLKAMVDEAARPKFHWPTEQTRQTQQPRPPEPAQASDDPSGSIVIPMRIYSLNATVPDKILLANSVVEDDPPNLTRFFRRRGVDLVRTIGDDSRLANGLIEELERRGLKSGNLDPLIGADNSSPARNDCRPHRDKGRPTPNAVALVAEWDTLYGRSLRREFRAAQEGKGFCIERFNYVRGLDGYLPTGGDAVSASDAIGRQANTDKDGTRRKDGTFIETAEGQSQFDYLRRLALQMVEVDREIRRTSSDGLGLRAIGVMGNDVHDKLLVMQALRPEFPTAIFFTTDMDARFLHPREQAWVRNLVIGSSFGLRLADVLQGGAPPFRSSYQTSAFLATRLALDDARRNGDSGGSGERKQPVSDDRIRHWFDEPRIFEIGRTSAFDFMGQPSETRPAGGPDADKCRSDGWLLCIGDIHPYGTPRFPATRTAALAWIFSMLLFALWAPAAFMHRRQRAADTRRQGRTPLSLVKLYGSVALAIALVHVALPLWLATQWPRLASWLTDGGKPLMLFEGISTWPTEGIRVLTLVLCFYLLYRSWRALSQNLDDIAVEFGSAATRHALTAEQWRADVALPWWRRLARMFPLGYTPVPSGNPGMRSPSDGLDTAAIAFWNQHIMQNRLTARLVRTSVWVAIALAFSWLLLQAIGDDQVVPQRGSLSLKVHEGLRVPALLMMYFLILYVVDATVHCVLFVRRMRELRGKHANWPKATIERFRTRLGLPDEYLDDWIDLEFIALRTRAVAYLIYYPFVVISLWLVSRNSAFDHWTLTPATLVPAVAGAVVAMACAVALRVSAERSRKDALVRVNDALMRAHAAHPGVPTVDQLNALKARIEGLHEGAFVPFWQQPLLKALLLPFATLGGTQLLDYMALANV